MSKDQEIKEALKKDYQLIPMKDITDEARIIAVAWMECGDKNWIGQKHKLASDIMNYARRHSEQRDVWTELKKDCLMPDYDEYVLWYREDGLIVYEHLDKDGNQWLYDSKIPYTHWKRIKSPVKEEKK